MTDSIKLVFYSKDVMDRLELKESVFKKYVKLLEQEGYLFERNEKNHRVFTEKDIHVVECLKNWSKYDGMTLEKAAREVINLNLIDKGHDDITGLRLKDNEEYDVMSPIETLLKRQENRLVEKIHILLHHQDQVASEREQKMMERLDQRDNQLMQVLREVQESKRLIASTQKKSFWQRLFGR